jgi:hypothetical protein
LAEIDTVGWYPLIQTFVEVVKVAVKLTTTFDISDTENFSSSMLAILKNISPANFFSMNSSGQI